MMAKGRALQAGLHTLLAFVLTSALFAAPLLAAQTNFGHTHPDGAPHHVHAVDAVLGAGALTSPAASVPLALQTGEVRRGSPISPLLAPETTHRGRAPPPNG